jgi:(1->4)-alpha-D-glucan 1-alpha-D-glucosylmutase
VSIEILATYRLQLTAEFGFKEATSIVGYLSELGISHIYSSPVLQAGPGSTHGYDVVDHSRVSADLGGLDGFERLCAVLRDRSMGLVIDIVPNHMAIGGADNRWWWDVLENGPASKFASYFDVEWDSPERRLHNLVLLPWLGDHYGRVLEAGDLKLVRDGAKFTIQYKDRSFPVAPRSLGALLESAALACNSARLSFIADGLLTLPLPTAIDQADITRRHRDKLVLQALLDDLIEKNEMVAKAVDSVIDATNADPDLLDVVLDSQNYRLAFWRTADRDLGYRRFFDINSLVGLRIENQPVFADVHALPLRWVAEGLVQGLRVDHVDGLRDPTEYVQRLAESSGHTWIVVEKILAPAEKLHGDWPVAGTTGYDFLNLCNGLFVDPAAEKPLSDFYASFTGEPVDYESFCRDKKRAILDEGLGSDLNRLTHLLLRVCERHRRHRDYTRHQLHQALREVIACFPVYRTYVRPEAEGPDTACADYIVVAIAAARAGRPDLDGDLFDFIGDLLMRRIRGDAETELVMAFQQVTPPAIAKGIEDTVFYCFNRMISLNEVGGDPGMFGVAPSQFYAVAAERFRDWPRSMLASSTHDTKRSEDVRARLNVLSEFPQQWCEAVTRWSQHNEQHWPSALRDRNIEYHLYQTIVGAWPISEERILRYLEKLAREAKVHTSWTNPDQTYENSVRAFVSAIMNDEVFIRDLTAFTAPLIPPGRTNSLAQTLIKLTFPGIPDIYQGSELWSLSLVDPDNRQPVDYEERVRLLRELGDMPGDVRIEEINRRADEGLPKLWLMRQALRLRNWMPDAFGISGEFHRLNVSGRWNENIIAYSRGNQAASQVATIVPRIVARIDGDWRDTSVDLPAGQWRNELTGQTIDGGRVSIGEILKQFPVGLLSRE